MFLLPLRAEPNSGNSSEIREQRIDGYEILCAREASSASAAFIISWKLICDFFGGLCCCWSHHSFFCCFFAKPTFTLTTVPFLFVVFLVQIFILWRQRVASLPGTKGTNTRKRHCNSIEPTDRTDEQTHENINEYNNFLWRAVCGVCFIFPAWDYGVVL